MRLAGLEICGREGGGKGGPGREEGQRAPACRLSPFSSCVLGSQGVGTPGDRLAHSLIGEDHLDLQKGRPRYKKMLSAEERLESQTHFQVPIKYSYLCLRLGSRHAPNPFCPSPGRPGPFLSPGRPAPPLLVAAALRTNANCALTQPWSSLRHCPQPSCPCPDGPCSLLSSQTHRRGS